MPLSTCINCDLSPAVTDEGGDKTLATELLIALSDCERSVSTFEAICTIFGINPLKTTYQDLPMCTKCGIILAELYRHFQMLMDLSNSCAYISTFIKQVEFWHQAHADIDIKLEAVEDEQNEEEHFDYHIHNLPKKSRREPTIEYPHTRNQNEHHHSHNAGERKNRAEIDYLSLCSHLEDSMDSVNQITVNGDTCHSSQHEHDKLDAQCKPKVRRSVRISDAKMKKRIGVLEAKKRRMKLTAKYRRGKGSGIFKSKTKISKSQSHPLRRGRPPRLKEDVKNSKSTDTRRIWKSGKNSTFEFEGAEDFSRVKLPSKRRERHIVPCENQGCKKVFLCYWMLDHHVQQDHLHNSPKECPTCGLKCFRDDILSSHFCVPFHEQKENRKLRPFGCNLCGRRMANRGNFTHHCTSHDTEDAERLRCNQCKLTFKRIENLRKHEKIHSMEKPSWQCAICGKVFYVKRRLKEHNEIHENEKKYLCSLCGMRFAQHKALVRHTFIHQDLSRYRCPLCEKGFKRKDHLHQHYRSKVHPKPLIDSLVSTQQAAARDIKIFTSESNSTEERGDDGEEGGLDPASLIFTTSTSDSLRGKEYHPTQVIFLRLQSSIAIGR